MDDRFQRGGHGRCPYREVTQIRVDAELVEERSIGERTREVGPLGAGGMDPAQEMPDHVSVGLPDLAAHQTILPGFCSRRGAAHHEGTPIGNDGDDLRHEAGYELRQNHAAAGLDEGALRSREPVGRDTELSKGLLDDERLAVCDHADDDARHPARQEFDLVRVIGATKVVVPEGEDARPIGEQHVGRATGGQRHALRLGALAVDSLTSRVGVIRTPSPVFPSMRKLAKSSPMR